MDSRTPSPRPRTPRRDLHAQCGNPLCYNLGEHGLKEGVAAPPEEQCSWSWYVYMYSRMCIHVTGCDLCTERFGLSWLQWLHAL